MFVALLGPTMSGWDAEASAKRPPLGSRAGQCSLIPFQIQPEATGPLFTPSEHHHKWGINQERGI